MIIGDTLYHHGIDIVLRRCLTHEETEKVLNDCHSGVCGGHQSCYTTAQNILRAGYFWPTMFKNCITAVRSCHACQIFDHKTRIPPAPLHPVFPTKPFAKWGIDFMTCNPTLAGVHGYIIVAIDYFIKWAEAMPTLNNSGEMAAFLFFNHVVSRFVVPQAIVIDHGSHFHNHMIIELAAKLGLSHDSSTSYYPQANCWCMAWKRSYQFNAKFHLLSSQSTFRGRGSFLGINQLDETLHDSTLANEVHKKGVKVRFDKNVEPCVFSEGDLVLIYDQESDKLGVGKFQSLCMGPYIVKRVQKGPMS
eukprot:PITA_02509